MMPSTGRFRGALATLALTALLVPSVASAKEPGTLVIRDVRATRDIAAVWKGG